MLIYSLNKLLIFPSLGYISYIEVWEKIPIEFVFKSLPEIEASSNLINVYLLCLIGNDKLR